MNMESIPVLVGIFLIFGVPLLLFAAYTTVLYYLIRKIPNTAVRILAPLGIALLFLFVELDNPFFILQALAVLLPFPLIEGHLQAKRKGVPVFICVTLTMFYVFITGFATFMSYSGPDSSVGPLFFDLIQPCLDSFQSDYLFKVVYRLMQFLEAILVGVVVYGILLVAYRVRGMMGGLKQSDSRDQ